MKILFHLQILSKSIKQHQHFFKYFMNKCDKSPNIISFQALKFFRKIKYLK